MDDTQSEFAHEYMWVDLYVKEKPCLPNSENICLQKLVNIY